MTRGLRFALAVAVVVASGCAPFKKSTAAMFARHPPQTRTFPAQSATVAPLAIGQWTLYRAAAGQGMSSLVEVRLTNQESFEQIHVTDQDEGRLRVRQRNQNKYQKVFTAAWVPGMTQRRPFRVTMGNRTEEIDVPWPRQAWAGWGSCMGGFSGPSAAYGCLLPNGPASSDRPEGLPIYLRMVGAEVLARFGKDPSIPRVDVTVPAGTFQQAIQVTFEPPLSVKIIMLKGPVTLWLHPAVPIDGIVKADVPGGAQTRLELVDFGTRKPKPN